MLSGAGETSARRRRDLTKLINLFMFFLNFWFLLFVPLCIFLSQNPNFLVHVVFFSEGLLSNGRVIRCSTSSNPISDAAPSLNPATEVSHQSSGDFSQTSEQSFTDTSIGFRSGLAPASSLVPSHRISLMAGVSLGPSDVSFPVRTSTTHDELHGWQVATPFASTPTNTSYQQNGGDLPSFLPTTTTLGFGWMGLNPFCGPITLVWPISRYALPITLPSFSLKRCCTIKDGQGLHPIVGTISLQETCNYNSRNLMDRVYWLSPDANIILKLSGIALLSNHRPCDAAHASALLREHIASLNLFTIMLILPAPSLWGYASQHSRIFWIKQPRYVRSTLFSSFFKPDDMCLDLNGRGLHPSLVALSAFWTCDLLWRIQQTYSSTEIHSSKSYSGIGKKTPPAASSMEHFIKSSYASFVRAYYDHKLIRDLSKLAFKLESLPVSKDLPTFAIFLKLCILENSLNLYPYLSCNALSFSCMNTPLMRI